MRTGYARLFLLTGLLSILIGCAVPQPHGLGKRSYIKEPITGRHYHLYLPKPYVEAAPEQRSQRRWPVVVSFHGMKPFDNSRAQREEWEAEADRYGYVVVAPELRAPDVLAEFPLRTRSKQLIGDEQATLKILDHVFATTQADAGNVLSTGWSSGGYMAHYMLNQHPQRFTALGVRQANFSHYVLDKELARASRDHPIFIVNTQNDFKICREESREAVKWYENQRYSTLAWIVIKDKGHERTPDLAAYFFAKVAGARPNTPATVLARRQALAGNREGIDLLRGSGAPDITPASDTRVAATQQTAPDTRARTNRPEPPAYAQRRATPRERQSPTPRLAGRRPETQPPGRGVVSAQPSRETTYRAQPTPARATSRSEPSSPSYRENPLSIRVSSAIGIEPLHLGYSAECPAAWHGAADFLWMLNGRAIGSGISGQMTLSRPGAYRIELIVLTPDGREHRTQRTIRVLPRLENNEVAGRLGN